MINYTDRSLSLGLLVGGRRVFPPSLLGGVDKDPSDWAERTINSRLGRRRNTDLDQVEV